MTSMTGLIEVDQELRRGIRVSTTGKRELTICRPLMLQEVSDNLIIEWAGGRMLLSFFTYLVHVPTHLHTKGLGSTVVCEQGPRRPMLCNATTQMFRSAQTPLFSLVRLQLRFT